MCPFACVNGVRSGECVPATECATTTRHRTCSERGVWSEPADCPTIVWALAARANAFPYERSAHRRRAWRHAVTWECGVRRQPSERLRRRSVHGRVHARGDTLLDARARGQCKDQSDCSFTALQRGTLCNVASSDFTFCDGSGNCLSPTVTCAGVPGLVVGADNVCCTRRDGDTESYEAAADCGGQLDATDITCDDEGDCRTGSVCCATGASGGSEFDCLPAVQCDVSQPFVSRNEVCSSPSGFPRGSGVQSSARPLGARMGELRYSPGALGSLRGSVTRPSRPACTKTNGGL